MSAPAPEAHGSVPPAAVDNHFIDAKHGSYDDLHKEVQNLLPMHSLFEGASFRFSRPVGNHLQVTHSLSLNGKDSNYHFSPTYIGNYHHTVQGAGGLPVVLGDITPDGSVIAQIIHEFTSSFSAKFQAQSRQGKWAGGQLESYYTKPDWTASVKVINVNPFQDSGIVVCNYLQKVSKSVSLGGELMYQYNDGSEHSSIAFAARHKTSTHVAALTLSPIGILQSSYFAAVNQRTAVGTQVEVDLRQADSTFNIGFQYNFREATFRGQISSKGQVCGFLEKSLMPGMKFNLCGLINHMTGETKFGFGFNIGQ